jgi:hypothetical protein
MMNLVQNPPATVEIANCYLRGAWQNLGSYLLPNLVVTMQNNFLERSFWTYYQDGSSYPGFTLNQYNNLFKGGTNQYYYYTGATTWTVADNLFDCEQLSQAGTFSPSHNGYAAGLGVLSGDPVPKANLVPDYQSGRMTNSLGYLGQFYYPTNGGSTSLASLIDAGSRTPAAAGLFQHTVTTNQVKDGLPWVDVGFHYVALDGDGNPQDQESDGLKDYYEDSNGNGNYDPGLGETDWRTSDTTVPGSSLQVFTPLK